MPQAHGDPMGFLFSGFMKGGCGAGRGICRDPWARAMTRGWTGVNVIHHEVGEGV